MFKQIRSLLLLIILSGVLMGCTRLGIGKQASEAPTETQPVGSPIADTTPSAAMSEDYFETFEFVADGEDLNALQATERRATVELKEYDFGALVESIEGQTANQDRYWALYSNDEYASAGASQTKLKVGDKVKWVFEEIKQGL